MSTEPLAGAIATAKTVLAAVEAEQLQLPTPCAAWDVAALINHLVGGQVFFAAAAAGEPPLGADADFSSGDFCAAFTEASDRCLAAFAADGFGDRMVELPFGTLPGHAVVALAATDTFTHSWDLAKATGQSTDLDPTLAAALLEGARAAIAPGLRNADGSPFGFEVTVEGEAPVADQLAAYLGRQP